MRKFWNGNASLPRPAGPFSQSLQPWKRSTGIAVLAMAAGFLMLAPTGNAQTSAPENGEVSASANPPAMNQAPMNQTAPAPPNQAGQPASTSGTQEAVAPARTDIRVVRLSDVEGSVQIMRGGQTEFSQAVMNMPLLQGSKIATGADGRAEIEFEDGSVARITPNSSLDLKQLEITPDGTFNTTVEQLSGLIYYELRSDPRSPYKVTIGERTVTPTVNSTFRVNLGATPPEVAVIDGGLHVEGAAGSYQADVKQGQTIQFGSANAAKYKVSDGIMPNGFDEWNDQRDQEAAQQAQNQTPARVQQGGGGGPMGSLIGYGWSDLDNAGGWYPLPGYGTVWQPYGAGPGFNPYGYGMWANYGGLGYSWISGYSWGWLPFNCGMWSDIGGFGWGWMPGGCGGFGFGGYGYGGYGYGRRWRGRYPYTNIARAPAGYRAPVPPSVAKGQRGPSMVRVGSSSGLTAGSGRRATGFHNARVGDNTARSIRFNGTKIAPLHSMMAGVHVPLRNAALVNNYPARAFQGQGGIRNAMLNRGSTMGRGPEPGRALAGGARGSVMHGFAGENRAAAFNVAHGEPFAGRGAFGGGDHAALGNPEAFGQHTSFGPRGGFGGAHSAFSNSGGAFRGGGGFHGGSGGVHGGGGFSGSGGGGFHGGGGGFSGGGGAHGGGGGGGAHGGH